MSGGRVNIGILISGRGSNMRALIEACRDASFPARVAVVVSNRMDAAGLRAAVAAGIEAVLVDDRAFASKSAYEDALDAALRGRDVDLVCLAGYMKILGSRFIARWPERILNIHPSLLPAYKGLNTHARVLADRQPFTGCTVHYVVPELDSGPAIIQARVPVAPGDTPDSLAARVLEQEHTIYPEAVRIACAALLRLKRGGRDVYVGTGKRSMSMDSSSPVTVDPAQLSQAQAFYGGFLRYARYAVAGIVLLLIGMAILFV